MRFFNCYDRRYDRYIDNHMARPVREEWVVCEECGGEGEIDVCEVCDLSDDCCYDCEYFKLSVTVECSNCDGLGYIVYYR